MRYLCYLTRGFVYGLILGLAAIGAMWLMVFFDKAL